MNLTSMLNTAGSPLRAVPGARAARRRRIGWLTTWPLADFLALLGTHRPVADLRTNVRALLASSTR